MCKLYAYRKLPRCHVQEFVLDVSHLLENVMNATKSLSIVKNLTMSDSMDSSTEAVVRPFRFTLSTDHRRLKLIDSCVEFIKPLDYVIGDKMVDVMRQTEYFRTECLLELSLFQCEMFWNNFCHCLWFTIRRGIFFKFCSR